MKRLTLIQRLWDRMEQWIDSPPMMPAPKVYMGQIVAECDCSQPDKCTQAEECLAARTES